MILVRISTGKYAVDLTIRTIKSLLSAVMSSRHVIRSKFLGAFEESVELDFPVAKHIRVRCTAFLIFVEHIVHYPLPILFAQVYKIKRYTDLSCYKLSHKTVFLPLAVTMQSCRCIMPVLHEKCKDIIALLLEHKSRNTGVNTARESDTHLDFAIIRHKKDIFK